MDQPGLTDNERRAYEALTSAGWIVARAGWPDFLVYDPTWDRGFGLEWKVGGDTVRPAQDRMHLMLQGHFGIDVLVTGSVSEALNYEPREPSWLVASKRRTGVERLQRELTRLERACALLRAELSDLEADWKRLKVFRDEQKAAIERGHKRLRVIDRTMRMRLAESSLQDSPD